MSETKTPRSAGPAERLTGQLLRFPVRPRPPEPLTPQQIAVERPEGLQQELRGLEAAYTVALAALEAAAAETATQERIRTITAQIALSFRNQLFYTDLLLNPPELAADPRPGPA